MFSASELESSVQLIFPVNKFITRSMQRSFEASKTIQQPSLNAVVSKVDYPELAGKNLNRVNILAPARDRKNHYAR